MANFVGNDTAVTWTLVNTGLVDTVMSHDGKTLYASTADGKFNAYDFATHTLTASWTISATPGGTALGAIALSDDGKSAYVSFVDGSIAQYDTATWSYIRTVGSGCRDQLVQRQLRRQPAGFGRWPMANGSPRSATAR